MVIEVLQSHGCSIEGADKPIPGADPACQVSIAHLGGFCNCDFSCSTYFEQEIILQDVLLAHMVPPGLPWLCLQKNM